MFGDHKVQNVNILSMEEIQRHLSYGTALVTLDNGNNAKINMNFLYKLPLGWRQQGWEMVSNSVSDSQNMPSPTDLPESGLPPPPAPSGKVKKSKQASTPN